MNECDEEKKRERERKSIQCKGLVLLCVYSLSLSIESDIRIESVDASLDVKKRRKKKRGTKSIRNEATAVEKKEK